MSEEVVAYGLENGNGDITSAKTVYGMSESAVEKLEDSKAIPLVRKKDE